MQFPERRKRRSMVSTAPLVDVVFLMLMFFLLTSSFIRSHAMDVSFVEADEGETAQRSTIVFRIEGGAVSMDGEPVDANAIPVAVSGRLSQDPDLDAVVLVDAQSPVQSLVTVVTAIRRGGLNDIDIGGLED